MENRSRPSKHLGELLRLNQVEDDNGHRRNSVSGLNQVEDGINDHRRNSVSGQIIGSFSNSETTTYPTLLDVLQRNSGENHRKKWKYFKDKLRLRRRGAAAWCSTGRMFISDAIMSNRSVNRGMIMGRLSTSFSPDMNRRENLTSIQQNTQMGSPENDVTPDDRQTEEIGGEAPVRLSLMALLEETEAEVGLEPVDDVVEEDGRGVECDEGGAGAGAGEMNGCCCVCMVRGKGSAFIPCGHTFCRLCSREIWIRRGKCPLCNTQILEILDIF